MKEDFKLLKFEVSAADEVRLDKFLVQAFERAGLQISRSRIEKLIAGQKVRIDPVKAIRANLVCKEGWKVIVEYDPSASSDNALQNENIEAQEINFDVLYEDNEVLVINKQANFVVHPGAGNKSGTLLNAVKHYLLKGDERGSEQVPTRFGLVHRLDKDTTGAIVFAKSESALTDLSHQFSSRSISKEYLALAYLPIRGKNILRDEDAGRIESAIKRDPKNRLKMAIADEGKVAITEWSVLERLSQAALLSVKILTGRTHQIRVHLESIGSGVLGDPVYGDLSNKLSLKTKEVVAKAGHQLLHAWKLEFKHPKNKKIISIEAPIPKEFSIAVEELRNV